jgi:hypothetical protein
MAASRVSIAKADTADGKLRGKMVAELAYPCARTDDIDV